MRDIYAPRGLTLPEARDAYLARAFSKANARQGRALEPS